MLITEPGDGERRADLSTPTPTPTHRPANLAPRICSRQRALSSYNINHSIFDIPEMRSVASSEQNSSILRWCDQKSTMNIFLFISLLDMAVAILSKRDKNHSSLVLAAKMMSHSRSPSMTTPRPTSIVDRRRSVVRRSVVRRSARLSAWSPVDFVLINNTY